MKKLAVMAVVIVMLAQPARAEAREWSLLDVVLLPVELAVTVAMLPLELLFGDLSGERGQNLGAAAAILAQQQALSHPPPSRDVFCQPFGGGVRCSEF